MAETKPKEFKLGINQVSAVLLRLQARQIKKCVEQMTDGLEDESLKLNAIAHLCEMKPKLGALVDRAGGDEYTVLRLIK